MTQPDITPDRRNANRGTQRGRGMLERSLRQYGAGRSVLADRNGILIAGNKTHEVATEIGLPVRIVETDGTELVVVKRTDLDLETDLAAVELGIADNRVGQVSLEWDTDVLAELGAEVDLSQFWSAQELDALFNEVVPDESDVALTASDVPDALFPSDNEWGVPTLKESLQATELNAPLTRWGSVARSSRMPATWHFYTDDYKFDALWDDPSPVVNSQCKAIIEPNFSTGAQMPPAVALWSVYRKRWLARWWQNFGVRVFVDLNVHPDFAHLNLLGVPHGWRAYATRGQMQYLDWLENDYAVAREHAGTDDLLFVVYGGPKSLRETCGERGWLWFPEDAQVKEGRWNG